MRLSVKKAQSIAEYVILLASVAAVFVGMQVYVRRGLQARLKDASDSVVATMNQRLGANEPNHQNEPNQYEPYYQDIDKNVVGDTSATENMIIGANGRRLSRGYNQVIDANQTQVDR